MPGSSTNLLTSTISGNKAAGSPGQGGGIYVSLPVGDPYPEKVSGQARYLFEMVIRACTIADNNAVNDGGGLGVIQGDVYLYNTILARNSAGGTGPDCYTDPGLDITSQGYNLIQDDTGFTIIPGTGDIQADPIMGLLADNGGPTKNPRPVLPQSGLGSGGSGDHRGNRPEKRGPAPGGELRYRILRSRPLSDRPDQNRRRPGKGEQHAPRHPGWHRLSGNLHLPDRGVRRKDFQRIIDRLAPPAVRTLSAGPAIVPEPALASWKWTGIKASPPFFRSAMS